jgi:hypothetical protein
MSFANQQSPNILIVKLKLLSLKKNQMQNLLEPDSKWYVLLYHADDNFTAQLHFCQPPDFLVKAG